MPVAVKICGLRSEEAVDAAVRDAAAYIGFVFYPASPRSVSPERAASLGERIPRPAMRCGLFVNAAIGTILDTIATAGLDLVQLHGSESPELAHDIGRRTGLPVMKAIGIQKHGDLALAGRWSGAVDMLLFDAKPPATPDALPGGNGVPFDWSILTGFQSPLPWMLSGGLTSDNLAGAVARSGARSVDVSSGVESRMGVKEPDLIRAFLERARALDPSDPRQ